jgi:hypothetical protein
MNDSSGAASFIAADADLVARVNSATAAQSLLAPLLSVEPPRPQNARTVTFDDEQPADSSEPTQPAAMSLPQTRKESSRRERAARRASRRSSLFTAAGF